MKNLKLMLALALLALALTACGSKDATTPGGSAALKGIEPGAQAEATVAEAAPLAGDEAAAMAESAAATGIDAADPGDEAAEPSGAERPIDLDLSNMSGTVVYSQVYDMTMNPEGYMGQRVRVKGNFSYFQDPATQQEYFAAIIADATACCAQGIEFVWAGEHVYPRDYPPLDAEIIVTGTFGTYYEGEFMYIQLADAELEAA